MPDSVTCATTCYMNKGPERGVAYDFWLRVRSEQAARGWTDSELHARSGISRTTIDRLAKGKRPPQARVVNALAETLDIERDEAHQLAGLIPRRSTEPEPAQPRVSVREAIMQETAYDDRTRHLMLQLVELIENATGGGNGRKAS